MKLNTNARQFLAKVTKQPEIASCPRCIALYIMQMNIVICEMGSWPALHVWVFIAQLVEHCSANAEATGSNPVEGPKILFSGYIQWNLDLTKCQGTGEICSLYQGITTVEFPK